MLISGWASFCLKGVSAEEQKVKQKWAFSTFHTAERRQHACGKLLEEKHIQRDGKKLAEKIARELEEA